MCLSKPQNQNQTKQRFDNNINKQTSEVIDVFIFDPWFCPVFSVCVWSMDYAAWRGLQIETLQFYYVCINSLHELFKKKRKNILILVHSLTLRRKS